MDLDVRRPREEAVARPQRVFRSAPLHVYSGPQSQLADCEEGIGRMSSDRPPSRFIQSPNTALK